MQLCIDVSPRKFCLMFLEKVATSCIRSKYDGVRKFNGSFCVIVSVEI